jgi:hypothetical protein
VLAEDPIDKQLCCTFAVNCLLVMSVLTGGPVTLPPGARNDCEIGNQRTAITCLFSQQGAADGKVRCVTDDTERTIKLALFDPATFSVDLALTEVEPELPPLEDDLKRLSAASTVTHVFHDEGGLTPFW